MDTQVLSPEAFVKKYGKPDVLCNDELMTADLTALLAAERELGLIEGITLYAYWRDGVQYVGTCGKTLAAAILAGGKEEG